MAGQLSPLVLVKFVLWLVVVVVATLLLRRRQVTPRVRIAFLAGGTLLLGFVFGLLTPAGGLDPNPVFSVRNVVRVLVGVQPAAKGAQMVLGPVIGMLLILLGLVWSRAPLSTDPGASSCARSACWGGSWSSSA